MSTTITTSIATAPQKASWLKMAPIRWPEPELSVGRHCSSPSGFWSKYHYWSLREHSPPHLMWKDLHTAIFNLIREHIEHLGARGSLIHFEIFMVGKHPAKESPTIVFCSENDFFREKAMKLVVKKILLEHHPGVLVAQSSKMPRPLAVGDSDWLTNLPEGVYAEGPLETYGISIYIVAAGVSPRRATIGGFVSILGKYYGLTTAHAFTKSESISPNENSDVDFGFGELGEPDDSSDDEDYLLELTSKGSVSSAASDVYTLSSLFEDELAENSYISTPNISSLVETNHISNKGSGKVNSNPSPERFLVKIGTLYATASPEAGLDWALVKINIKNFVSLTLDQDTLDQDGWTKSACHILNNETLTKVSESSQLPRISIASKAHDTQVLVYTGKNEGHFQGCLSAISSYAIRNAKVPQSITFQELWNIQLKHSSLVEGDCGSWVLDAQTGQVYGHVVSGYPTDGSAYLIPALQIFRDIQERLGQSVRLPERRAFKSACDQHVNEQGQSGQAGARSPRSTSSADSNDGVRPLITNNMKGKGKAIAKDSRGAKGSPEESDGPSHTQSKAQGSDERFLAYAALKSEVDKLNRSPPITGASIRPAPPQSPTSAGDLRPPLLLPVMQQLPIRQSIRIQDISPPLLIDESACLKKLTTYTAYTIRECPPRDPKKERRRTWARVEVIEEHWLQEDILKQVEKLDERGRSVADKTKALASNMQLQITTLIDNLTSSEKDNAFEWSLIQLDTLQKPVSFGLYETVTMTAFAKRSPRKELNPIILFERIKRSKVELVEPLEHSHEQMWILEVKSSGKNKVKRRSRSRQKKYHEHDDSSTGDSVDSDTGSHSSFTGSDSMGTSISSMSHGHRRHSHSNGALRGLNKLREHGRRIYLDQPLAHSPDLPRDTYSGSPQHYKVPHVPPHAIPTAVPALDPVATIHPCGKVDESELRCEFEFIDCHLSFHPSQIESYIFHTASHFLGHLPPRRTFCIFCDKIFEDPNDPVANWTRRIRHIADHYRHLARFEHSRPDFLIINYMRSKRIISSEDYKWVTRHSERPHADSLVDRSYRIPEMKRKEERLQSDDVHKRLNIRG